MKIGDLAKRAAVSVETVRFYERKGLLEQPSRPIHGGFRSYPSEAVSRIGFIRHAQALGFTLGEVGDLLNFKSDPAFDCADVLGRMQEKRQEVEARIQDLKKIRASLEYLIECCPAHGPVKNCSIVEALDRSEKIGLSSRLSRKAETMVEKRRVEIFSAGCQACRTAISQVQALACSSCEVIILDMQDDQVAGRARNLGIRSVPAVVIDGQLAECCAGEPLDEAKLKEAGLGQPIR